MGRFTISWIFLFSCCVFSYSGSVRAASASKAGKTWIVCVPGFDRYRFTYGFEAGIYNLCKRFAGNNTDSLIIISPNTAAYHVNNGVPGMVVHGERFLSKSSKDVYDNVSISYNSQDITVKRFFGILSGDKSAVKGIGSEKVVQSGPEDTIILVFINIGDYGIMTLTNTEYLYADKFIPFLEDLKEKKKFKQMLILVDGQNAGSMFDGYLCEDCNIIALTNTAKEDDLELCHPNRDVMAYTSTCYTYFLLQQLEKLLRGEDYKDKTLFDLYQETRTDMSFGFDAISNLYGHLDMGNMKLSELFSQLSPVK